MLTNHLRPLNVHREGAQITMQTRISTSCMSRDMFCSSCSCYHTRALPEEIALVVGNSQLRNIHINKVGKGTPDNENIDYLSYPGEKLDGLAALTCYYYMHVESSLKILLVGGYNDILRGRSRSGIMESLETFYL